MIKYKNMCINNRYCTREDQPSTYLLFIRFGIFDSRLDIFIYSQNFWNRFYKNYNTVTPYIPIGYID